MLSDLKQLAAEGGDLEFRGRYQETPVRGGIETKNVNIPCGNLLLTSTNS